MKYNSVHRTVLAALFTALCVVLPVAMHIIPDAGTVFLPMHIPVLMCGLICGVPYGFLCGLLGPALSCLLTGMPSMVVLPAMMVECATYGFVTGLMMKLVHTRSSVADVYLSLVAAMIAGRVAGGIATTVFYTIVTTAAPDGGYSIALWAASYFVEAVPGIIIHLCLIPGMVFTLQEARLIPARYPREAAK